MKTLVTGASGHVGNNLVRRLLEQGREVRAMVRKSSNTRGLEGLEVEIVYGDLLDEPSIRRAVDGCRVVYQTAAAFLVSSRNPQEEVIRPTQEGSRNVLRAALEAGVEKVIYTSSVVALGYKSSPDEKVNESHWHTDPRQPYVVAKTESERWAHQFHKETGLPVVFVLPALILGPGDYKVTPSTRLVLDYLNRGFPFIVDGGLNVVDVRDVTNGMIAAELNGRAGERYILGGDDLRFEEMMLLLSRITGLPAPKRRVSQRRVMQFAATAEWGARILRRPPLVTRDSVREYVGSYRFLDLTKAEQELGYSHKPAGQVLYDTVQWCLDQSFVRERRRIRMHRPLAPP